MTTLRDVILKIKTLKETITKLDKSSDGYLELNNDYQKLLLFKEYLISNSELAVNGIESRNSLIAVSEALGSFETSLLMFDSDDHSKTDGLYWHGIPTIRAGKKDKNHAGKSNELQSQRRPSPLDTIAKSMREIYPTYASGTKLHLERKKKEGRKSPSTSPGQAIIINQDNTSRVSKSNKEVIL